MFDRIKTAIVASRTRRAERETYERLLNADDHLLRDINVSRADLRRALTTRAR